MEIDTIVVGDCLDVMAEMPDGCVDLVIADPPYGVTACKWDTIIPLESMWVHLKRITRRSSTIVLTAVQPFTTMLISSNMKMFKYCWVWNKQSGGTFVHAKHRPFRVHEDIVVFSKGVIKYNPQMVDADIKNQRNRGTSKSTTVPIAGGITKSAKSYNPRKRYPKTIISISGSSKECHSRARLHPTQKPIALMEYLIKTYTNIDDTVFDFVIGSGTTAVAALRLGRHFYGCDISPEYVKLANERIEKTRLEMAQLSFLFGQKPK